MYSDEPISGVWPWPPLEQRIAEDEAMDAARRGEPHERKTAKKGGKKTVEKGGQKRSRGGK